MVQAGLMRVSCAAARMIKSPSAPVAATGSYVSAVNELVKFRGMAPTVGILVCGSKHEPTVRYALDESSQPMPSPHIPMTPCHRRNEKRSPHQKAITAALEQRSDEESPDAK